MLINTVTHAHDGDVLIHVATRDHSCGTQAQIFTIHTIRILLIILLITRVALRGVLLATPTLPLCPLCWTPVYYVEPDHGDYISIMIVAFPHRHITTSSLQVCGITRVFVLPIENYMVKLIGAQFSRLMDFDLRGALKTMNPTFVVAHLWASQ